MKKYVLSIAMLLATSGAFAQVAVPEPEFVGCYNILTSDTSFDVLPKESGDVQEHKNKVSKWSKIASAASRVAGAAGVIGMSTAGSMSGVVTGARVVGAASSVGQVAGAANALAGAVGMDIVFSGGKSSYQVKDASGGIRLLVKAEDNERDPMDIYRIVKFKGSKKERRVQWMEFQPALLGTGDASKAGFISFRGHKYGEQSYILEIPAEQLEKGEYGIFFYGLSTIVPTGTFSVK